MSTLMSHDYPLVAGPPFRPARMRKIVVIKASPDGRYLVLGSNYGTIELLEIAGLVSHDSMFDLDRNYGGTIGPGIVDIVFHPYASRFVVAMKDSRIVIVEIKVSQLNNNRRARLVIKRTLSFSALFWGGLEVTLNAICLNAAGTELAVAMGGKIVTYKPVFFDGPFCNALARTQVITPFCRPMEIAAFVFDRPQRMEYLWDRKVLLTYTRGFLMVSTDDPYPAESVVVSQLMAHLIDSATLSPARETIVSVSTHGKLQWFDIAGFRNEQDPYNAQFWHQGRSNRITQALFGDDYTLVTGTEGGRVDIHALVNLRPCGRSKSVQITIPDFEGLPVSHLCISQFDGHPIIFAVMNTVDQSCIVEISSRRQLYLEEGDA